MAGVCYRQGKEADKAFLKQLEEVYQPQIKGKKNFYYHFNSKRLNKEKLGLLLNGMGDLVTVDIDEAEALNAFSASNPHWWSPRPLFLETGAILLALKSHEVQGNSLMTREGKMLHSS